jgi:Ricin-type beta-trefoil lectin domain-like
MTATGLPRHRYRLIAQAEAPGHVPAPENWSAEERDRVRISPRAKIAIATMLTAMAGLAATAVPASAAPAGVITPPPEYTEITNANSHLCLGVSAEGTAGQWTCTGANNQEWKPVDYADGYYIQNANGQCLYAASTADGTQVYAGTGGYCTQNTDDWVTWTDTNNVISPRTYQSAVIGVAGGSMASGAPAVMWNPGGNIVANQEWYW